MKPAPHSQSLFVLIVTAFLVVSLNSAEATSATWIGTLDATWSTSANWSTLTSVPGTGDTATFNNAGGTPIPHTILNLGAGVTINTILFNTSSAAAYTIGSGTVGSQTLTFIDGGAITINSTVTNNQLFNANVVLGTNGAAASYTFTNNSTTSGELLTIAGAVSGGLTNNANNNKTLTIGGSGNGLISGVISGTGSGSGSNAQAFILISKTGAGTWTLSGNNTYGGSTTISGGTLSVSSLANGGSSSNIGQSSNAATNLVFNGGTLQYTGGTATTDRNFTINAGQTGTIDVTTAATNLSIAGATGTATTGALTKIGSGTLTLTGANTYTGATTVSAGTLLVNGSTASGSAVTVNSSGTLGGTGTVNGTVSVVSGGTIDAGPKGTSGTSGAVGTLTTGALTLASGSTFHADAFGTTNATQWDHLVVGGAGTAALGSATFQLNIASGLTFIADTVYTLIDATTISGIFAGMADGTNHTFDGYTFTLNYNAGGDGNFELTAVPEPSTWVGGALAVGALAWSQRRRLCGLMRLDIGGTTSMSSH